MKVILTKIVGTSFNQPNLAELLPGVELRLIPEPENPHDSKAVKVETSNGKKIGYISTKKDLAQRVFETLQENKKVTCKIIQITGGGEKTKGVNIELKMEQ